MKAIRNHSTDYYQDRASRMMAFIEYPTVEEATRAVHAWQSPALAHLGSQLRINYAVDPTQKNIEPYHTLRISGYSGGLPVLRSIAGSFRDYVWRVSDCEPHEGGRQGKGVSVGYIEFLTIEHATEALEKLRNHVVNGDEHLKVTYAMPMKGWQLHGGVSGRDHGGYKFGFGISRGEDARDVGANAFHAMERKEQWSKLERIATYLGTEWKAENDNEARQLVRRLIRRRRADKAKARKIEELMKAGQSMVPDQEASETSPL